MEVCVNCNSVGNEVGTVEGCGHKLCVRCFDADYLCCIGMNGGLALPNGDYIPPMDEEEEEESEEYEEDDDSFIDDDSFSDYKPDRKRKREDA